MAFNRPSLWTAAAGIIVLAVAWRAFSTAGSPRQHAGALDASRTEPQKPLPDFLAGAEPFVGAGQLAAKAGATPPLYVGPRAAVDARVGTAEVDAGVQHISMAIWLRFGQADPDAYASWRKEYGYSGPTPERLSSDPLLRSSLRRQAGLAAGDKDPAELFAAIWEQTVRPRPRAKAVSASDAAHVVALGVLTKRINLDPAVGPLTPFPLLAKAAPELPTAMAALTSRTLGQVWPYWQAPIEVQRRITQVGTPLLEMVTTLASPERGEGDADRTDTIGTLAAYDRTTNKWWIVQAWIYNIRPGGGVNGALY